MKVTINSSIKGYHAEMRDVFHPYIRFFLFILLSVPLLSVAQTAPGSTGSFGRTVVPYTPPTDALSTGSILQVIFSLLLVLGAVMLVAWVLKRINLPQHGAASVLKVISGVAVGQRERIVLVEVNNTWLVVGVAPGQVRTLHTMPKSELPISAVETQPGMDGKFQFWLKQMMEKRNAG
jgi:flagellar protein FliO/FliZ